MKVIVCGGRDYKLNDHDRAFLSNLNYRWGFTEIVSGGCPGADIGAEVWAEERQIEVKRFPAMWEKYGNAAGPIRNQEMANYADACVLFPGGKGTADMAKKAELAWLIIWDYRGCDTKAIMT